MVTKAPETQVISLKPMKLETIQVRVKGITELIVHAWSEKARKMMLEAQQEGSKPRQKKVRESRNPEEEYKNSMYYLEDGAPAFPAQNIKAALVAACRMYDGIPMTLARVILRVNGSLIPIEGTPHMREDTVRLSNGSADLRYRAGFSDWSMQFSVSYPSNLLKVDDVLNLINAAGMVGIGDWRPSSKTSNSGIFGTFEVDKSEQIEITRSV